VDAGIFHDFHNVWLGGLRNLLNDGILPSGYYALTERHAGRYIAEVLTLHAGPQPALPPRPTIGGVAVAAAPPKVRRKLSLSPAARSRRKTLAIRHVSGHRSRSLRRRDEARRPRSRPNAEGGIGIGSFVADMPVKAYLEHLAANRVLPEMPLFLDPDYYINVPLEETYQTTWRGTPEPWRRVLEGGG
jgi:hypothetical protein